MSKWLDHLEALGVLEEASQEPPLPAHVGDWPEEWLEAYIERAGIMEYDGGLPRPEAERRAEALVREVHRRAQERQL